MQQNVVLFGTDIITLMTDFATMCCFRLNFEQLEDTLTMLNFAVQNFKTSSLNLTTSCMMIIFEKVNKLSLPTSNTSETEKSLIRIHQSFLRFINTALDELGIQFTLTVDQRSILNEIVDFLLNHFYNGIEISDKKVVLRQLKMVWLYLNPISPISDVVLSKK